MINAILIVFALCLVFKFFTNIHYRKILLHPFAVIPAFIKDIYKYFKYKKYNECKFYGKCIALVSSGLQSMGCGKTLGGVWLIVNAYNYYNGKMVWNDETEEFQPQKIRILSNVEFTKIPYEPLKDVDDIANFHKSLQKCEVGIVFVDEGGAELNARNFRTNLSAKTLKSMVTCRHKHMGMIFTSQTFDMLDALLRRITDTVYLCSKVWRSCMIYTANARDYERCENPNYLNVGKTWYFATDELYSQYDTHQMVEDLTRAWVDGELLTNAEELASIGEVSKDPINVNLNKKYYRRYKKGKV